MKENVSKIEYNYLKKIYFKNKQAILNIKQSKKCYGQKARQNVSLGITDNIMYARKLLQMK